ncbi:enoyl-CoA hydratase [Iodidimonas gelatinilytica]|uniref:Enoyl-CoA hydratase n=1 Tax=Iodidimonas gelatinilytica TaxID=1236966 RepID=A0A5A7N149_9PROT|nr:enoyl-CoA hydratase-related protein [Iodidimonas gelatinilytica]GER02001.1 enoyl-CoA hydratase [Iodidimonas gelatinilytica]
MTADLLISRDGAILEIGFNRPAKKNALTEAMYKAIADSLEQASDDPDIRVVLFYGEGGIFTSGNDLNDFAQVATGQRRAEDMEVMRVLHILAGFQKPVIAAVEGLAVGIGLTLLLHCDLAYVAQDARLTAPFVDLALVPEAASSLLMPACIGHQKAFALFALGEALSGDDAARLGLANAALPAGDVLAQARLSAQTLAKKAPGALAATKL